MKKISILLLMSFMMSCNQPVLKSEDVVKQIFENNERIGELQETIDRKKARGLGGLAIASEKLQIVILEKKNEKLWKTYDL